MKQPEIRIKPKAKCHGLSITLAMLASLLILALLSSYFWQQVKFVFVFLIALSIAGLFLGLFKLLEPKFSFYLSPKKLTFQHRKGQWQVKWQNIKRIFPVTNTSGIEQQELNYIGLTLSSLDILKDKISLRLANHLIHEQQPLITYCVANELIKPEQGVMNFEAYLCEDGEEIKGPLAGFFHQCEILKQALGAHIYITGGNIDRSLDEFAVLLSQCKTASVHYK